jgi:hypothetical protein
MYTETETTVQNMKAKHFDTSETRRLNIVFTLVYGGLRTPPFFNLHNLKKVSGP